MNDSLSRDRARQFHASYHGKPKQRSMALHGKQKTGFQSPGEVSANEEQGGDTNTAAPLLSPKPPKQSFWHKLKARLKRITKKQWIIIGIVAGILLIGGGTGLYFLLKGEPEPVQQTQKEKPAPPPEPTTVASNLTGVQVDPSVNQRPVTAIMIENSPVARPQSGLLQAGVVFEAIAEGGITRFSALYQDSEPDYIGPVRSVRKPWLHWILGFDAPVAHVGGSAEALQLIRDWGMKDLDQFANSGAYWRIPERSSPHNAYTSIARLREVENSKGYGASKFTSLARKDEQPSATPSARTIDIDVSSGNYKVHYDYDPATNSYKRSIGGAPHVDQRSGDQLTPKVVVVPVMTQGRNGVYTTYDTIGDGAVYIFQDGNVSTGRWSKSSNEGQFTFTDNNGDAIHLNPGQTWFTIVGSADRVTSAP